jgi:hypothetical protein
VDGHRKRALRCFSFALGSVVTGVLFVAAGLWPLSLVSLYAATLSWWIGCRSNGKARRMQLEREWWIRAKRGIEQPPLTPCCMEFEDTGFLHDEPHCTRYRYGRPRPITREELTEINLAWAEIIAHLEDPEYGEEA